MKESILVSVPSILHAGDSLSINSTGTPPSPPKIEIQLKQKGGERRTLVVLEGVTYTASQDCTITDITVDGQPITMREAK